MGGRQTKIQRPSPTLSPAESAQLELRRTRDRIQKFQKRLRDEHDAITEKAKSARAAGRNDQALYYMKLRKIKDKQLETISGQLLNLEELVITIDSESQNQAFLKAVSRGNDALKSMQALLPLEAAQRIMEDSADAVAYQNEINDTFASLIDNSTQSAEADLEAELDSMTAAFEANAAGVPSRATTNTRIPLAGPPETKSESDLASRLPAVPTFTPDNARVAVERVAIPA